MKTRDQKSIVIMATAMGPANRGIGQYERYLLPPLLRRLIDHEYQISIIVSQDASYLPFQDKVKYIRLPVMRDRSNLRFLFEQIYVPYCSFRKDIFLSLETVIPFAPVISKRKLVVVHDIHVVQHMIDPMQYPEDYSWKYKIWANYATRKALKASDFIVTVSKFTKEELMHFFRLESDRIISIPNGVDHERFYPILDAKKIEQVRKRYRLPPAFYLFVGPYSRKKNLKLIAEAYALSKIDPDVLFPIVIAGDTRRNELYMETMDIIKRTHKTELFHFIGFVRDDDLSTLYTLSKAFIYPSLYEGFGLPVLEAMACGTPVIASDVTSVPEVAGDAAVLIDPFKPESLIHALHKVNDNSIRKILIQKGFERAQQFSWEHTADLVADMISCQL